MKRFLLAFVVVLSLTVEASAVSIMYTEQTTSEVTADAATIKGLNIDVIMNYYPGNSIPTVSELTAYLDMLQGAGLKGMIDLAHKFQNTSPDLALLDSIVAGVKEHPALYGWYMQDEPTSTSCPLAVRQTIFSHIKAIDSVHPIWEVFPGYGAGFWPVGDGNVAEYSAETHTVFGVDNYPVLSGGSYSTTSFQNQLTASYNATAIVDRSNFIGITQSYGGGAGLAAPTAAQMTSIASVIQSTGWAAKGMAFWIWHVNPTLYSGLSGATFLKGNTGLWSTVTSIAAQYHEDLYNVAPVLTAASHRATMRASFR